MLTNWFNQPVGNRSSTDDGNLEDDTLVMEPDQGNGEAQTRDGANNAQEKMDANTSSTVLSHLISQLRPGADLSRVVLPTFILEPRSMLERITKYETMRRELCEQPTRALD